MQNNRIKFLKGSITSYLNMFLSIILNILLVRIMLQGLGKYNYGLWVTISSLFGFMILSDLGLGQSATKLIAEREDHTTQDYFVDKELVSTTFYTNLLIGFVILLTNIILSVFVYKILNLNSLEKANIGYVYILLSVNFFITFIFSTFRNVLIGYKYISANNILNLIKNVSNFILITLVLNINKSLYSIAIVQITLSLIFGILSIYVIKYYKIKISIKFKYFSIKTFKVIFKPGAYYLILQFAGILGGNTDNLILNYFISPSVVAIYSAGYKLAITSMQLVFTVVDNLFPFISQLDAKNNNEKLKNIFMISEKYSIYIGIFIMFTFIIFGRPIMEIWIGEGNYVGDTAIFLFSMYVLLNIINHVPIVFLQGMNKHSVLAKLSLVEALVNVVLSIILVEYFGAYGAILGTVIADIFLLFWYSTYKLLITIKMSLREYFNILKPSIYLTSFMIVIMIVIKLLGIQLISNMSCFFVQYAVFVLIVVVFSYIIGIVKLEYLNKKGFKRLMK
jgi:O-antigen/teichoic acid export membrane protein